MIFPYGPSVIAIITHKTLLEIIQSPILPQTPSPRPQSPNPGPLLQATSLLVGMWEVLEVLAWEIGVSEVRGTLFGSLLYRGSHHFGVLPFWGLVPCFRKPPDWEVRKSKEGGCSGFLGKIGRQTSCVMPDGQQLVRSATSGFRV